MAVRRVMRATGGGIRITLVPMRAFPVEAAAFIVVLLLLPLGIPSGSSRIHCCTAAAFAGNDSCCSRAVFKGSIGCTLWSGETAHQFDHLQRISK